MKIKTFLVLILILISVCIGYKAVDDYYNSKLLHVLKRHHLLNNSYIKTHHFNNYEIAIVFHKVKVKQNELLGYKVFQRKNKKWSLVAAGAKPRLDSDEIDYDFESFGIDKDKRIGLVYGSSPITEESNHIILTTKDEEFSLPIIHSEHFNIWYALFNDPADMNTASLLVKKLDR